MKRKWLVLLLMPGVLLTQSAALGHRHASCQPSRHDSRPHVHTRQETTKHGHTHHHHGSSHHHHHDEDGNHVSGDTAPDGNDTPPRGHDDDAVYLATYVLSCVRETSDQEVQFVLDSFLALAGCLPIPLPWADQPESKVRPPPGFHLPRTPLSVTSIVLMI